MFENLNQKIYNPTLVPFFLVLSVLLENLGVNFDEAIKFYTQISLKVKARHFSLATLPKCGPVTIQDQKKVSHSFLSSHLDYCKSVKSLVLVPPTVRAEFCCLDFVWLQ